MIETAIKEIAQQFSSFIIGGYFKQAYKLTSQSYQEEKSLVEVIEEYKDMVESYSLVESSFKIHDEIFTAYDVGETRIDGVLIDMRTVKPGEVSGLKFLPW